MANVLFGKANPGGKLPMTFPRSSGQLPLYYNYKPSGGRTHWHVDYVDMSVTPLVPVRAWAELHPVRLQQPPDHAGAGRSDRHCDDQHRRAE